MRKQMLPDVLLNPIDMLTYKKALLSNIQKKYQISVNFSDEELIENRTKNNEKVTKILHREVTKDRDENNFRPAYGDQTLDYFHKPKFPDNQYFITASPTELVHLYSRIETCVTYDGSNSGQMYHMLASPYVYLVSDSKLSARMAIMVDPERKIFILGRVYGSFDVMMEMVLVKHFKDLGYAYIENLYQFFETDDVSYIDSHQTGGKEMLEYFGVPAARSKEKEVEGFNYRMTDTKDYFQKLEGMKVPFDIISGSTLRDDQTLTTTFYVRSHEGGIITDFYTHYCGSCGSLVDEGDYDFDSESCLDCSYYEYCNDCGENVDRDFYEYDYDMCRSCAETNYPEDFGLVDEDDNDEVDKQIEENILERKEKEDERA
jgi:hypothetical protein